MENEKTDTMPMSRVLLMSCGRYNPPTHMHLRMFERARDHLHRIRTHKVIGGVISPVSDHCGKEDLASSSTRGDLLKLALQTSNWIRLSTWEIRQKTAKSTRETLRYHQNVLNSFISNGVDNNINGEGMEWIPDDIKNNSDQLPVQIKLLCGSDLLESFLTPGQWSEDDIAEIVGQYGLVVIGKEGVNPNKFIYDSDVLSKYIHNIHVVTEWIPNEVNATRIRRALRRGESVKYLLQNDVIEFIYKQEILGAKRLLPSDTISTTTTTTTRMSSEKISGQATTGTTGGRVILMSCGSYNPPTHMHLRMFERARDHLHNLGSHVVIGGVISPVNDAYAKKELASGGHRVEMLRLALGDSDWIKLSTWEIRQAGWTRTRQCLQHHQALLDALAQDCEDPNSNDVDGEDLEWLPDTLRNNPLDNSPVQIKLLCGGDLLESFATPGLWMEEDITEIVSRYGLIVITREGSHPYKFIYDSDVLSKNLHNIQIVTEWIPNEVSSTRIRRALKRGESVKYLLQDPVIDYVYENGIYGAERPSTIKLNLSSIHSSTDYLDRTDGDEVATKLYNPDDNAFLTPSPSDITMLEASPPREPLPQAPETDDDDDDDDDDERLSDSVLQKNLQNNHSSCCSDERSSPSLELGSNELAREKFFRSLVNDSLTFADKSSATLSLSSLLLHGNSSRLYSQIDSSIELPSSARARNELLAFEDTTESELATLCGADSTCSEDREDVLSVTYEESSAEDLNESLVRNNAKDKSCRDESGSDRAEDTASSLKDGVNESLSYDESNSHQQQQLEESDSQATAKFEIDGKYIKSLVNSKKNGKKLDDGDEEEKEEEEEVEGGKGVPTKVEEEEEEEEGEKGKKPEMKFEDDLSYIKKLRLVINSKPSDNGNDDDDGGGKSQQRQLQGSLDSINLRERDAKIRTPVESMSKKSKSFESIKRFAFKPIESYAEVPRTRSDSTSQLVTAAEHLDDFCTACCYEPAQQPSSSAVFYSARSNCSSPAEEDEDSTECDICSSCNLRDPTDEGLVECKQKLASAAAISQSLVPEIEPEICEICGEPAEPPDIPIDSRLPLLPFGLPKAKSTIEISRGSYRTSRIEDERFEIDNCGQLQDCKLRASLDVCNKPEPLYVNVMPRYPRFVVSRHTHQPYSESEYYYNGGSCAQHEHLEPKDEYCSMSRSLSIGGGSKRLSRRGSYPKKSGTERTQDKRRFSSADNLQNRTSFRCGVEKFSKSRDNKFMTSADSIRTPRIARSRSLRRSADNVGRFDYSSGDNLDSLEETNADTDENAAVVGENNAGEGGKCARVKIKDSDTIKMILTKHGIKIISQKETVL